MSCAAFLLLGYLLRDHFSPRPGLGALARDLPMRFLAGRLSGSRFLPADLAGRLLYVWVFLLFWIVALGALTAFFLHTRAYRDPDAAGPGPRHPHPRRLDAVLHVDLAGKPVLVQPGRASRRRLPGHRRGRGDRGRTIRRPGRPRFRDHRVRRFCEHRGLQPCLYSVTAQARAVTQRLGWKSVQIAEDTLLPLEHLQFTGKKWQDVRTALNKAAKEGITAQWWSYPQAPPDLAGQIRQISQTWMADKGLPEMGFTLGGLDELNDPNIRCLIAVGADRTVHGITSWMPVYASGRPVGWTLDFMRRNTEPGTFRGVMEFLIATAARPSGRRGRASSACPARRWPASTAASGPPRCSACST